LKIIQRTDLPECLALRGLEALRIVQKREGQGNAVVTKSAAANITATRRGDSCPTGVNRDGICPMIADDFGRDFLARASAIKELASVAFGFGMRRLIPDGSDGCFESLYPFASWLNLI
jgi:hypothetical protein